MSPKPQRSWEVLKPGPLVPVEDGVWCIEDDISRIPGAKRRMTIVRQEDGGLVFFNAVPVPDAQLEAIRALGKPAQLVVPSHLHMLHAHAFAQKLGVPVFGPPAAIDEARQRVPDAQSYRSFPADPSLELVTVDGFVTGEGALLVKRGERLTLVVGDVLTNQRHAGASSAS
jgi:hypothetical protein